MTPDVCCHSQHAAHTCTWNEYAFEVIVPWITVIISYACLNDHFFQAPLPATHAQLGRSISKKEIEGRRQGGREGKGRDVGRKRNRPLIQEVIDLGTTYCIHCYVLHLQVQT